MSYPCYPAYQDSGIAWLGKIPKHWNVVPLSRMALVQLSNVDKHSHDDEISVQLCNYTDVYHRSFITGDIDFMNATATEREIAKFLLKQGDVLITKDSESWFDIAVPAFVADQLTNVLCGYHLAQIRPFPEKLYGGYLFRAFQSAPISYQFHVRANGITRYAISGGTIASSIFPLPPLDEQRAIVAFLDVETSRIDTLVAKQERMIALLEEKRKAVISHAVTRGLDANVALRDSGVAWLGMIPEHWGIERIKQIVSIYGGGTPSKEKLEFWDGNIPWVSPKDMKTLKINDSEDHITQTAIQHSATNLIDSDAVLIVFRSGILKHTIPVAINTVPVTINQDMKAIVPDNARILNIYFVYIILGNQEVLLAEWSKIGATVDSLETSLFRNTLLPLPPLDEQRAIVAYLDEQTAIIDTLIAKASRAIDLLGEHRAALISAAVTGQIDVRGVASAEPA